MLVGDDRRFSTFLLRLALNFGSSDFFVRELQAAIVFCTRRRV